MLFIHKIYYYMWYKTWYELILSAIWRVIDTIILGICCNVGTRPVLWGWMVSPGIIPLGVTRQTNLSKFVKGTTKIQKTWTVCNLRCCVIRFSLLHASSKCLFLWVKCFDMIIFSLGCLILCHTPYMCSLGILEYLSSSFSTFYT